MAREEVSAKVSMWQCLYLSRWATLAANSRDQLKRVAVRTYRLRWLLLGIWLVFFVAPKTIWAWIKSGHPGIFSPNATAFYPHNPEYWVFSGKLQWYVVPLWLSNQWVYSFGFREIGIPLVGLVMLLLVIAYFRGE